MNQDYYTIIPSPKIVDGNYGKEMEHVLRYFDYLMSTVEKNMVYNNRIVQFHCQQDLSDMSICLKVANECLKKMNGRSFHRYEYKVKNRQIKMNEYVVDVEQQVAISVFDSSDGAESSCSSLYSSDSLDTNETGRNDMDMNETGRNDMDTLSKDMDSLRNDMNETRTDTKETNIHAKETRKHVEKLKRGENVMLESNLVRNSLPDRKNAQERWSEVSKKEEIVVYEYWCGKSTGFWMGCLLVIVLLLGLILGVVFVVKEF